ncbi:hypothetical protein E2R51_16150 [Jeotgalibacillus sp. S-D1]|uniref:hypothetical protein n=1 Tax=Jeotgalibacillus sp. S-D1 TaxID=2552189 RepID=UPI001059E034|nr:hypothetical protein [Jeotgalibacillus sp. S-D1]TDL30861.1 hypothetical protein E2R51_16150 [Jeotgalibacillus sp. S-D1]
MNKLTKKIITGSIVSAGTIAAVAGYKKIRSGSSDEPEFLEDTDMRNSADVDQEESVDADKVEEEEGLTKLDSVFKSEWQANGFPQTHQEMKRMEEEEKE